MRALRGVVVIAAATAVVAACAPDGGRTADSPGPGSADPSSSATGGPADWQVLFDGTSTDAFRRYGGDAFPADRWVLDGEALRTIPGAGVDLTTREAYADFELEFEWRVAPGGNSGMMYRVRETAAPAWASGPEYQVLDDALHPDGARPETSAGAVYDLIAPSGEKRLEPVGSFNAARIVVRGGTVEHWLNGLLVVRYGWDDAAIRQRIDASKFADAPDFMRQARGHIVLQHHGEEAWFRAVRIRPLDP